MPSVIIDTCTKDMKCVEVCQRKNIHPRKDEPGYDQVKQLFINPKKCLDCGSCIAVCETKSIYSHTSLPPDKAHFAKLNADYYRKK